MYARTARAALPSGDNRLKAAFGLSFLLFTLAAGAAVGQLTGSGRIQGHSGCGWDGYYYCAMLKGAIVPKPFSRRILLPFLAKQVETGALAGFWVVNILSLLTATLIAMYVAWKLRPVARAHAPIAYSLVPPLLVGTAFLSARNTFHLLATYPALSDPLALLLLVGVMALVVTPALSSTRLLLIPICFLAPLAREELAGVLVLALLLAAVMGLLRWLPALTASAAAVAGGAFALFQPNAGSGRCVKSDLSIVACPDTIVGTLRFWFDADFSTWNDLLRFGVMLILAFGPFIFLLGALRASTWNRRPAVWIAGVAAIFTAVSILGGGDTDRILTPVALLLALSVVLTRSVSGRAMLGLSLAVGAYLVQQEPLRAVSGEPTAWLTFFGLRVTTIESVVHNGLIPTLIAVPLGVAGFLLLRSKEDHVAIRPGATLDLGGRESSSVE